MKKVKMLLVMVALVATVSMRAEEHAVASLILTPGVSASELNLKHNNDTVRLSNIKGKYVLVQFWANAAEGSLKKCIEMNIAVNHSKSKKIEMVAVSFEPIKLIYDELAKKSDLNGAKPTTIEDGVYSDMYQRYRLSKGLNNYLLDENGVIVAKDLSPADLAMYDKGKQ